jgi:hypothetical protein
MNGFVILFAIFCLVCALAPLQHIRIVRYFKATYPAVWATFGFAGNGWWVEAEHEAGELAAQRRLKRFLDSDARHHLDDSHLNRMIAQSRTLNYCGGILFVVVIALWLLGKAA